MHNGYQEAVDDGGSPQNKPHAEGDAPIKNPEFEKVTLPDGTTVKHLKPNMEYQANGYTYKMDIQGRIKEASGTLRQGQEKRSNHHQRTVGKNDGRLDTDQGRHLIGNQFDGAGG
ncbi:DNA/RNA non-specific endonuclease [Capnocytophaga canimorsus]|uniref:DNA/RNA non-specific endonuclease n=1 Tax=Capnocytophaga canimorsus TaxID=28188 RepID=UPI001562676F|nr:DNA/RNA non-specific endonuclease [Capnocytophaga canimorsus]